MVPKCLKGIINAHIQRSIMYAGYRNDFEVQTSSYFLRLMTLYLSRSLLLGDTGEKETSKGGGRRVDKDKCTAYGDQIFNYTQG